MENEEVDSKPRLLVITGPSFSGKTSIAKEILTIPGFGRVTTSTMRPKRPEEIDGVDYHFRSKKYFSSGRKNGIFFECQEVRKGKWYGSEFTAIDPVAKRGLIPVVTLDVEGAKKMLTESRVHAEIIYVLVSKETLLVRAEMIRQKNERGDDTESLAERIKLLDAEIAAVDEFTFRAINEGSGIADAMKDVRSLLHVFYPDVVA